MSLDATTGALKPARLSYAGLIGFAKDAIGYGAASGVALVVDYGSLVCLNSVFHVNYLTAAYTAFSLGLVVAYILNTRFVFKGRSRYSARAELAGFLITGLIGLALNQAMMYGFVTGLGLPVAAAKLPTVGVVFMFNFLSRRFFAVQVGLKPDGRPRRDFALSADNAAAELSTATPRVGFLSVMWPALAIGALFVARHPYEGITGDGMIYIGRAIANLDPGGVGRDLMFQNDGQSNFTLYPAISTFLLRFMTPLAAGALLSAVATLLWFAGVWALVRASGERRLWAALAIVATSATGYAFLRFAESTPVPRPYSEAFVLFALAAMLQGRTIRVLVFLALAAAFHPIMALPGMAAFYLLACLRDRRWIWLSVVGAAAIVAAAVAGLPLLDRLTQRMDAEWLEVVLRRNAYLFPHEWAEATWSRQAVQSITILVAAYRFPGMFRQVSLSVLAAGVVGVAIAWFCGLYLPLLLVIQAQTWRMSWLTAVVATVAIARLAANSRDARERLIVVILALAWSCAESSTILALTLVAVAVCLALSRIVVQERWVVGALAMLAAFVGTSAVLSASAGYDIYYVDGALRAEPIEIWTVALADLGFFAAIALTIFWSQVPEGLKRWAPAAAPVLAVCAAVLWYAPTSAQTEMFAEGRQAELAAMMPDPRGEVLWLKGRAEPWAFLGRPNWGSEIQGASIIFSRKLAMIYKDRSRRQVQLGLAEDSLINRVISPPTTAYAAPSREALRTLCSQADAPTYVVWPPDPAGTIDADIGARTWSLRGARYDLIVPRDERPRVQPVKQFAIAACASHG